MTTARFWRDAGERAARTFAQALLAVLGVGATDLLSVDWPAALSTAGSAALISVLFSVVASQKGDETTASLLDDPRGRHEAP